MKPELSYSIAAFPPGVFAAALSILSEIAALGFRHVTFTPTYPVREGASRQNWLFPTDLAEAVEAARALAMRVRIEPHLDYESTLAGGPYKWRSSIALSPAGQYLDDILRPLAAIQPAALTIGSELETSLFTYPHEWRTVLTSLANTRELPSRAREGAVAETRLGHKINHDTLDHKPPAAALAYLQQLNYVAFSFYRPTRYNHWTEPTQAFHIDAVAREFIRSLRKLHAQLPDGPEFAIGEFGLGCSDPKHPWHFEGPPPEKETRRKYYLGFLRALEETGDLFDMEPVTLWTAGYFDLLHEYRDEVILDAIARYNGAFTS